MKFIDSIRRFGDFTEVGRAMSCMRPALMNALESSSMRADPFVQLSNINPNRIQELDQRFRRYYPYCQGFEPANTWPPGVLIAAAMHHNGIVRNKAVDCLEQAESVQAFAIVAERCNDWVPQIQGCAHQVLVKIAQKLNPQEAETAIPVLVRLMRAGRVDMTSLARACSQCLVQKIPAKIIHRSLRKNTPIPARLIGEALWLDESLASKFHMSLFLSCDQFVASRSVSNLLQRLTFDERKEALDALGSRKSRRIRQQRLQFLIDHRTDETFDALVEALVDKSPSIRELASYFLNKDWDFDFAGHYRKLLDIADEEMVPLLVNELLKFCPQERRPLIERLLSAESSPECVTTGLHLILPSEWDEFAGKVNKFADSENLLIASSAVLQIINAEGKSRARNIIEDEAKHPEIRALAARQMLNDERWSAWVSAMELVDHPLREIREVAVGFWDHEIHKAPYVATQPSIVQARQILQQVEKKRAYIAESCIENIRLTCVHALRKRS